MTVFWNKAIWLCLEKLWDVHEILFTLALPYHSHVRWHIWTRSLKPRKIYTGAQAGPCSQSYACYKSTTQNWDGLRGIFEASPLIQPQETLISREGKSEVISLWMAKMELKPRTLDSQHRPGKQPWLQVSWVWCGIFWAWAGFVAWSLSIRTSSLESYSLNQRF